MRHAHILRQQLTDLLQGISRECDKAVDDASDAKDALKRVQAILGESSAILVDLPPEPGRITPATFEEADFNTWLGHEPKNQHSHQSGHRRLRIRDIEISAYHEVPGDPSAVATYERIDDDRAAFIGAWHFGYAAPTLTRTLPILVLFRSEVERLRAGRPERWAEFACDLSDLLLETAIGSSWFRVQVGSIDSRTHDLRVSTAGADSLDLYRSSDTELRQYPLGDSIAVGIWSKRYHGDAPPSWKTRRVHLSPGDALISSLEFECARSVVGSDLRPTIIPADRSKRSDLPETISVWPNGTAFECLDDETKRRIIEAAARGDQITVNRYMSPFDDGPLCFDFGTVEDALLRTNLALPAVRRAFQMVPDVRKETPISVMVDLELDSFLKQTFERYQHYFGVSQSSLLPEDSRFRGFHGRYRPEEEPYVGIVVRRV